MKNEKIDLRKISPAKLQKIKTTAMKLRDEGVSNKEVAQKFGLYPNVVSRWYRKHVENFRQLQDTIKRGRKQGTKKKLSNYQEDIIIKRLQKHSDPLDKELVKKIIEEKYNMKIPISTIGDYLRKWGINSSFIKEFEKEFVERVGGADFQSIKQEIMKRRGIIIWVNIMDYELTASTRVQSISTRAAKNKLVFKLYKKQVQTVELVEFVNQIATLFTKHLYVFFNTKHLDLTEYNNCINNSEKITFIHYE